MERWILTDDNCRQYLKKISSKTYCCVEIRDKGQSYLVCTSVIDLTCYADEDLLGIIKTFGYESFDEVRHIYGDDVFEQIIAECVFEMTPSNETTVLFESVSFEKCQTFLNLLFTEGRL